MKGSSFIVGWYAIEDSKRLKSKPLALERFGLSLVLWRTKNNTLVCMLDRCPHRGAKLSLGKVGDDCIQCPYHGFKFNSQGQCQFAPEFNKAIPKLEVSHFSVREFVGMIWIFYGESPSDFSLPILEDIDTLFGGHYAQIERTWQSHITYCIENQLDYTHLPDVHHNTIGRNFKLPKNLVFNLDEKFISIHLDKEEPALNFCFPNTWILNVAKKMKLMVFFAPINEKETILYLRTYNPILKIPVIRTLLSPLFNILNAIILKQDKRVVQSQGSGVSCAAQDDRLMKHDKAIAFFRKIWRDNS